MSTHTRRRGIAVIDAETDPFKFGRIPRPFVWGFYDGEHYQQFDTPDELIDFLSPQRLIVYAHNGGRFDYHFLFEFIELGEEVTVINGRVSKFKIAECEFRDSWNLLPVPLAEMQKDEIDYKIMERDERDKPENRARIDDYLKSDCVYLWNWVNAFIDQYGLKLTIATTALNFWSKQTGVRPPQDKGGELYAELRPYYHGGRTQAFEFGEIKEDFQLVDIRSAYPYAMMSEHPIGLSRYWGHGGTEWRALPIGQRRTALMTVYGVSRGALPYRTKNRLDYPDDNEPREYHITGWEYIAALETKTFKGRIQAFVYFDVLTNFADYVMHFYNMKQASEKGSPEYKFAKLFMNALYGKFAANPEEYRDYLVGWWGMINANGDAHKCEIKPGQMVDDEWSFNCEFGEDGESILISRPQPEEKQKYYNLATSASITGFVRAYLWRAICQCGGVLYCDTDSIAARDVSKLTFGSELGEWDNEGTFDYGAIGGRKLYAFHYKGKPQTFSFEKKDTLKNWKLATKGVKLEPKSVIKVARGEVVAYQPMAPTFSIHKGPHFITRNVRMTR